MLRVDSVYITLCYIIVDEIVNRTNDSPDTGTTMWLIGNSVPTNSPVRVYVSREGTDTPYTCVWFSLHLKGHIEISPTVSLVPLGNKKIDEFVDVVSLIGTAGPVLLQVSTFSSWMKGASCPDSASTCKNSSSPTVKQARAHGEGLDTLSDV